MNRARHQLVTRAAYDFGGVVSRWTLRALGVTHDAIRHEVEAGRWLVIGNQTVVPHTGDVSIEGRRWSAIWEIGRSITALDGVTALQAGGLRHYTDDELHVSVVHTAAVKKVPGVRLHKVIRRLPDEIMRAGVPRTKPPVAALRGAYWAVSDRQAALILLMTVQQRLATPEQLLSWSKRLRGRRRRAFIEDVLADLAGGAHSLGELDFARMCRQRGLPEPSRQVVRLGPKGRMYLDVRWKRYALVVEIDGAQHREGLAVTDDNLSRNAVTLQEEKVLRLDRIGLRLYEDEFMAQVARGLEFEQAA
ncbi:MAG: hypothetical protein ABIZ07_10580 [Dermatophilaceae bacterium]